MSETEKQTIAIIAMLATVSDVHAGAPIKTRAEYIASAHEWVKEVAALTR